MQNHSQVDWTPRFRGLNPTAETSGNLVWEENSQAVTGGAPYLQWSSFVQFEEGGFAAGQCLKVGENIHKKKSCVKNLIYLYH